MGRAPQIRIIIGIGLFIFMAYSQFIVEGVSEMRGKSENIKLMSDKQKNFPMGAVIGFGLYVFITALNLLPALFFF